MQIHWGPLTRVACFTPTFPQRLLAIFLSVFDPFALFFSIFSAQIYLPHHSFYFFKKMHVFMTLPRADFHRIYEYGAASGLSLS